MNFDLIITLADTEYYFYIKFVTLYKKFKKRYSSYVLQNSLSSRNYIRKGKLNELINY